MNIYLKGVFNMANNNEVTITSEEARALRNECNRKIELANALSRLFINEDFKRVFSKY